tara:strand:+ start:4016 stop:4222 length:207 start_codon:yes stop_codon:yes gene_type:complete
MLSEILTLTHKKAGNQIRTGDPRITNALLYQLSYPGVCAFITLLALTWSGLGNFRNGTFLKLLKCKVA